MKVCVFARSDLLSTASGVYEGTMLLEGSWPGGLAPGAGRSLDDTIDSRFEWIDEAAAYWAERLAQPPDGRQSNGLPDVSPYWLNVLALRYYLVKLIRVVAYFTDVAPLRYGDVLKFVGVRGHDEDYADLFEQLCRNADAGYRLRMVDRRPHDESSCPPNGRLRRSLGSFGQMLGPGPPRASSRRRVVLCGNPRLLDPVCRELIAGRARVWWLYDRFAVKSWLRWRPVGGGQLVCNSSLGVHNRLVDPHEGPIDCRGVDLAGSVARWIAKRLQTLGPRQTRILDQIDAHFGRIRPQAIVLDEDATPFARAAVAMARRHGARSHVVQHGAPCCRFGFAPAAADQVLVWGESSQWQLARWSVPAGRIQVTGSPRHDDLLRRLAKARQAAARRLPGGKRPPFRVLLLATVPPRDDRPDSVALNLTRATYAEMLRTAVAVVERIPESRLIVKLHPRAADDPIARQVLAGFPSLASRVVTTGSLEKWVTESDCVLSCASSAGVEATLAGVPVIQLLAPGTGGVLPHQQWGMLGTARSEAQLERLLAQVLAAEANGSRRGPDPSVFANLDGPAAARIARAVLAEAAAVSPEGKPEVAA
jgi:hypothetical protein